MTGPGQGIDHRRIFDASSSPTLVLDPELILVTANRAYLAMTDRRLDDIVGKHLFEVFPDNPDAPDTVGEAGLRSSFDRVVETGAVHRMGVYRYDLARSDAPGGYEERYWSMANTPIRDEDGEVVGIVNTVEDVTGFREDLIRALEFYRLEAEGDEEPDAEELNRRFERYAGVTAGDTQLYSDLVSEVEHLRRALTSRASIDQAKGIVMARHGCDAEQAFDTLARLSQEQNLKLRDLAAVLVERVCRGGALERVDGGRPDDAEGSART